MKTLPFYFTPKEILNENRTSQENIDIIKDWLLTLEESVVPEIQDELIILFLLSCDNDIPLTKNTIVMYYKCKAESPEIFDDREMDRADIQKAMNTIQMCTLPVRTEENYAIHYFRLNDTTYSNFDLVPTMKLSYMLLDITQERKLPHGLVVIIDLKGIGLMHLSRLKLNALKKYFQFLQEGFPLQLKVIHIINAVYFFDKIMNIIRVFMKSELVNLLKVHPPYSNQERLYDLVPKYCWPKDYGGDLPEVSVLHEKTKEQFEAKQEYWRIEQEIRQKSN
ncbi:alpha-tocopherol transfer protein-like [Anthonomus grandis grandis]|uniref:alpha-tocopherol transfer protein-like n=1 Tax=Anthonomus grandis grandis TaxID=2921223 RepID=UPI002165E622|nr:alpha-tocopherol transfer protein-like [Anthonomus grandis grandis]XP_050292929.1 alpha-tocopherol transfer protein-like [Anthonomus grandis grandis]